HVVGLGAVVATHPHLGNRFGWIHRLHRMHKPFLAIGGYVMECTEGSLTLLITRTRINQLTGGVVKRSTIPVTFNKILLNLWPNFQQGISGVPNDRVISQDPEPFLDEIINRYCAEASQYGGTANQFGGRALGGASLEPFV